MKLWSLLALCTTQAATHATVPEYDHLRKGVVRIQAVSAAFNWLEPFFPGNDQVGLGSGFVVQTDPYPLFATNEHVINDAKFVTLQLLLYGEHRWDAKVVSVCPKFDLALLVLQEPEKFSAAMKSRNITLQKLKLSETVPAMGEDVMALGFPLGQDSLKISKGNIAGNEDVDGNICIQSTAPISPGSSGGPLLNGDGSEVLGVNFAKATEGENINYVIPAWRVGQLVRKHLQDQPQKPASGEFERRLVKVPMPELTTIESNKALYKLSGGCSEQGVWVSRVGARSFLRNATPALPEAFFLVSVGGTKLDKFGMGLQSSYVADRVFYSDLFYMVKNLNSVVEFQTCSNGQVQTHTASMEWRPEYDHGIRWVTEPYHEGLSSGYEIFGDISVMEMTINHISMFLNSGNPGPARWLHPDLVTTPRLVINYVRPGTYISNILSAGAVVSEVNGRAVLNLVDFRESFLPKEDVWTMKTDLGKIAAVMFNDSLNSQLSQAQSQGGQYLLTPSVVHAAQTLGIGGFNTAAAAEEHEHVEKMPVQKKALLSKARRHEVQSSASTQQAQAAGPLPARRTPVANGRFVSRTSETPELHLNV